MIKDIIQKLIRNEELDYDESKSVASEIILGEATPSQIASFITALRIRGESALTIAAFAEVMRENAKPINVPKEDIILDTCGTGGDLSNTFNISTAAALICAAAGIKVAKHGNRAVSSQCGSADVLESLGVKIDCSTETSEKCLNDTNFCFLFAPMYHSGMKHAAVPRREIGIRTIFNLVGPLSNPAKATHQLLGVYKPELTSLFADVLATLGTKRALLVYGSEMLDEISLSSTTSITELLPDATTKTYIIEPSDYGFEPYAVSEFAGGNKDANAGIIMDIIRGVKSAKTNIVLLNAGAAIYIADKAESIKEGIELAKKTISSGAVADNLQKIINITNNQV